MQVTTKIRFMLKTTFSWWTYKRYNEYCFYICIHTHTHTRARARTHARTLAHIHTI